MRYKHLVDGALGDQGKEAVAVISKGKLVGGLASVGVAGVVLLPASAGAQAECDPVGPGCQGLTTALIAVTSTSHETGGTEHAASVIVDRLAANHNETVLQPA